MQYLQIVLRRWWLAVLPVVAMAGLTSISYRPPNDPWLVRMTLQVGLPPVPSPDGYSYDGHYNWLASEYLTRSVADLVVTSQFADNVSLRLAAQGQSMSAAQITGAITRDFRGTLVNIVIKAGEPAHAVQLANAISIEIAEGAGSYFPQLGLTKTAPFKRLDNGQATYDSDNVRNRLDIPVRAALAVLGGVGLTLLAHVFDPVLRSRQEVERLGMHVIGHV